MSSSDMKMASKRMKAKKQIPEKKLQAFSIGCMGKRGLSKKEQDEMRKKEEDEAAAHAFQEFVETFQETPNKANKVWIKAGTYDAGARKEDTKDKGKLYKPTSRISEIHEKTSAERAQEYARLLLSNDRKPDRLGKKKEKDKKKSNLELFKEELKMIQEEREERHKYKGAIKSSITSTAQTLIEQQTDKDLNYLKDASGGEMGSFDNGDPKTTNLYLGNLNPKITEQELMEVFGRYGPLASIKIMWPRSDEEKARRRNCGFVAFMNRQDGERALKNLNGRNVMNYEIKLGWGKAVPIVAHPIYIPPSLKELTLPPPQSGLPFNAQLSQKDRETVDINTLKFNDLYMSDPEMKEKVNKILYKAVVKVVMPTERSLLMLIHRMVEFVIREGPMFEAMIMNREMNNPLFRFLFENNSPAHIYYRWKLYSLLQGEQQKEWSTMEFRMFKGGSIWRPPPMNVYTQGMPEEQIFDEEFNEPNKGSLSVTQRDRLEDLLRYVTPERSRIAKAMVFCMEHSDAADEICDCIVESLSNDTTTIPKKLGRFFLVSDILANCAAKISNASFYRRAFESRLISIFLNMNLTYKNMESRLKAESFKNRVMLVTRAWEEWAIFPQDFIQRCQNTFLGIVPEEKDEPASADEDVDGAPLSSGEAEEDLDGVPLDGAALLKGALLRGLPQVQSSPNISKTSRIDLDISESGDDIDGTPIDNKLIKSGGFVPSKWETVDPIQVEAQAITTSKWDTLEQLPHKSVTPSPPLLSKSASNVSNDSEDESIWSSNDQSDTRDLDEERRLKLREIEVKSMQYQDELECGSRTLKSGWSIQQQVEHYRRKLIRKSDKEAREKDYDDKSPSPEIEKRSKSARRDKTKRSDSSDKDHSSRHRSRSPHSSKKKRSPSVSSRNNKRRHSNSPDSPSPIRKHHKSSVSPERKYYQSSPGSSRKHQYNNLSPVRTKYGRVPTPSPPRTSKYESPYNRRSISPTPTKTSRYNNSVSPPAVHYRSSKHSSPPRTKHRARSPSPKRHSRHSPSPTRSTSSKHSHTHRERDESSSRKHKHKYKH